MPTADRAEFAALVRQRDEQIDLARAALLLARIHGPVADPDRALARLDEFADWLRLRLGRDDPEQDVRRLSHHLAQDEHFYGNTLDYSDPRNSCLNHVIERRAGIPISLSVVWLEVGWRLGMPLAGVGLPGHFLVKYSTDDGEIILDPFHGGVVLDAEQCAERLRQVYGRRVALAPHHLAAVTRKQILTRMLTNLKHIYLRPAARDLDRALATIEHLLAISPWALDEIRDRGLVRWQAGDRDGAIADLETYLQYNAEAEDAAHIRRHLATLRGHGG